MRNQATNNMFYTKAFYSSNSFGKIALYCPAAFLFSFLLIKIVTCINMIKIPLRVERDV